MQVPDNSSMEKNKIALMNVHHQREKWIYAIIFSISPSFNPLLLQNTERSSKNTISQTLPFLVLFKKIPPSNESLPLQTPLSCIIRKMKPHKRLQIRNVGEVLNGCPLVAYKESGSKMNGQTNASMVHFLVVSNLQGSEMKPKQCLQHNKEAVESSWNFILSDTYNTSCNLWCKI